MDKLWDWFWPILLALTIVGALVAMRRYLIRAHRAAWRTYRKAHTKGGK